MSSGEPARHVVSHRDSGGTELGVALEQALDLHRQQDSVLGGVHFELTGDDVTECIGGARGLNEAGLERAYLSQVDPRLNYEQALEMAMAIVRKTGN